MYGKLIKGELITVPEKMLQYDYGNKHICAINPTEENYIQAGYKPIEYEEVPEGDNSETVYEETEEKIIVRYSGGEA